MMVLPCNIKGWACLLPHSVMYYHMSPRAITCSHVLLHVTKCYHAYCHDVLPHHSPTAMGLTLNCNLWKGAKWTFLPFKLACPKRFDSAMKSDACTLAPWGGYRMGGNRGKYINFKEEGAESRAKTTAKGGVLWRETRYFWWWTHRHLWHMNEEYLCWQMFLTVGLERFVLESVWPSEYSLPKKRCFSSFFLGISGVGDSAIKPIAHLLVSFKHIPWLNM